MGKPKANPHMGSPHKAHVRHTLANAMETHIAAHIKPMSYTHGQTHGWVAHIKPMLDTRTHGQNGHMRIPPKAYVGPLKIDHRCPRPSLPSVPMQSPLSPNDVCWLGCFVLFFFYVAVVVFCLIVCLFCFVLFFIPFVRRHALCFNGCGEQT